MAIRSMALACLCLMVAGQARSQAEFALPPGQVSFTPIRIGADKGRVVRFLKARSRTPAPLVIFLDDWEKPGRRYAEATIGLSDMLRARGIAFALVPADRYGRDQGAEVAQAIAALKARAGELEIDLSRVAVVGEGLGAAYAALIATDPRRAAAAGLALSDIRTVILLDGYCYDVEQCFRVATPRRLASLRKDLPEDAPSRAALSALRYAGQPNVASIYLHFDPRSPQRLEGDAMAAALRSGGQDLTLSSALMRFDQHAGVDTIQRERPNANSGSMIDFLAKRLDVR